MISSGNIDIDNAVVKCNRLQRKFETAQERRTNIEESFQKAKDKNMALSNIIFRMMAAKTSFFEAKKELEESRKELESMLGEQDEEGEEEESSASEVESKEDDSLFLDHDESEETSEVNAGFQGELILLVPDDLDYKIFIVDEKQKYNESKAEIERMLLESQEVKILYEDPYSSRVFEHVLTMSVSVNLFDNMDYEGMLLKA